MQRGFEPEMEFYWAGGTEQRPELGCSHRGLCGG